MAFSQAFLEDLRRQVDIVRVINDYVPLKKTGTNWMACCPFHQEKSPSFSVNPARAFFHCFGCGKGGNVFSFVMAMERVSFPESVKLVAAKANIPLPADENDSHSAHQNREVAEVIELNTLAAEFWASQLQENNPEAQAARDYLAQRGISEATCQAFQLGYAPDRWDMLLEHLRRRGVSARQMNQSGLIIFREGGNVYDRFRGRIMFPVLDARGQPVAFGGRVMGEGEPKYLNSPATPAYVKGQHLYGLWQNRQAIQKQRFAILAEGYLDVLIPYQAGVRNIIASLGTAFTPEQAKLLGRFARKIVVNYDGDKAGIKAAQKAIATLLAEDFEIKVLVLPDQADPDEFIRKFGAEEYNRRRGAAQPHIQFIIEQAKRGRSLSEPAEKAAAVEEVLPFLAAIRNQIQRREYFDIAMNELRVEDTTRRLLWDDARQTIVVATKSNESVAEKVTRTSRLPVTVVETKLLALLIHDAELMAEIVPRLETADYEELTTAPLFRVLVELTENGTGFVPEVAMLQARFADDEAAQSWLAPLLSSAPARGQGEALDDFLHEADSYVLTLRLMMVERRLQVITSHLAAAQRAGDEARLTELAREHYQWTKYRHSLRPNGAA